MFWSAGWEKVKTAPTDWPFNDKWSRRMESLTRSSDPVHPSFKGALTGHEKTRLDKYDFRPRLAETKQEN